MDKFFKFGDISAFIGSLGLSASLFYLGVSLPDSTTLPAPSWIHWTGGVFGLVLSILSLLAGLFYLQVHRKLYRPNLRKDSHKWLAVVELVGGGILTVMSGTALMGLWDLWPGFTPMAVTGIPLGLFAIWLGIHVLAAEQIPAAC